MKGKLISMLPNDSRSSYNRNVKFLPTKMVIHCLLFRNETKFLLGGLKVDNKPTWQERQNAYMEAVKAFLLKLNQEFGEVQIKFVRSLRVDPRLFLVVECQRLIE